MKNKIKKIIIFITPPFFFYFYGKIKKIFFPQKKSEIFYEKNFYNRRAFIFKAIKKYNNCKYLEIGVNTCETFNSIPLKIEDKFGVDPIAGNYQMKSDEFFKKYPDLKFDVIFIDGLHHYEQCQRDCINSIKQLNKDGIILIHDLLPHMKNLNKFLKIIHLGTEMFGKLELNYTNQKTLILKLLILTWELEF